MKSLPIILYLLESLLLSTGILALVYFYMIGGMVLLLATAVPVYAVFGAFYLGIGLILKSLAHGIQLRRYKRNIRRRQDLQHVIDSGSYRDIQPGTPWESTRIGNSIAR